VRDHLQTVGLSIVIPIRCARQVAGRLKPEVGKQLQLTFCPPEKTGTEVGGNQRQNNLRLIIGVIKKIFIKRLNNKFQMEVVFKYQLKDGSNFIYR
jgi:hypothetical protein